MGAVAAGVIAFMIYTTSRIATPDLALLYSDLDAQDSSQIVSRLERMELPYRLSSDASQIFVPHDQVARLRLTMAEDGLPTGGSIGYEIFDRSEGLGTTNFVQNVNHLRALEGELSRTIRSISSIKQARVHLVMPKRELFTRERQEPTASIVLAMNGNQELAHVSKKWAGLGKELFTSADNYMLEISSSVPADNPVRLLILAAVMCIDMVLKE